MCGIAKCSHKQAPAPTTIYRSGKDDMSYTGHINTGKGWVAYTIRVSASRSILVMAQATDTAQSLSVDTKDWSIFSMNAIHVVFLDASHDFESVMQDIDNCLRIPTVSLIIFDDYGAEEGVRMAVQRFVSAARLRPVAFLGEGAAGSWRLRDGREVQDREAVACEVLRP
ncbi:unnamed protein product [Effrenium voratum]|nr:unnamed protein product [Effrenium voratum]